MTRQIPCDTFIEHDYSYQISENGYFDPYELIFQWGKSAIATARAVRHRARSYRDFKVGAACISINEKEGKAAGFASANYKPSKEEDKVCAEMNILGEAKKQLYNYPVGLFVVGTTDPEQIKDVTRLATPTLHPCDPCRTLLNEATVVISAGHDEDIFEVYTGKQLWQVYTPVSETTPKPRRRKSDYEGVVVRDPNFIHFMGAETVYAELMQPYKEAEERATRMLRAEAVVEALQLLAV